MKIKPTYTKNLLNDMVDLFYLLATTPKSTAFFCFQHDFEAMYSLFQSIEHSVRLSNY